MLKSWMYRVTMHEFLDTEFVRVTLHCLGFPSKETHPDAWDYYLKVPYKDLSLWPIGMCIRLEVH